MRSDNFLTVFVLATFYMKMFLMGFHFFLNMSCSKKPILYGDEASPPVRFVMMTASLLNIELEFRNIDLFKAENRTEEYKKINRLQKVPALSIAGETICDSHAIVMYLCRLCKHNDLYPEDAVLKAKIDEMMYYNAGVLFPIDSDIFTEYFAGNGPPNDMNINKWHTALEHLEFKLNKHKFLVDDKLRLCDLCCGATVSSLGLLVPLPEHYKKLISWLKQLQSLPCYDINKRGLMRLEYFVNGI